MAQKVYLNYKKLQQELFNRTEGYATSVRKHYLSAFTEIIDLVKGTELEDGVPFSFSEYGYTDQVQPILRRLYSQVYQTIRGGVNAEWLKSNEHTDELIKAVFGKNAVEDNHFAKYFQRNQAAMDAFFARKSADGGLNLSQRVWKYTGEYKEELENTLDLAIGEGTPAMKLAAKVKQYLNDPDRYYRRFRYKVGEDENGKPIYGLKWKRRVFDKETGTYSWIDDKPSKYSPGKGVYRSSARNAQRLARSETNMAYRTADYDRWQQLDFVIGVEIKLSNNHPEPDICDDLKGIYPKDFKWTGWHPNCRCYMQPVLASQTEVDKMTENILDGEDPKEGVICSGEVKKMPEEFNQWLQDNQERMEAAKERGTLPYFVRDNEARVDEALNWKPGMTPKEIAEQRHAARTAEQIETIKKAWELRKEAISLGDSVLKDLDGISDIDTTDLQQQLNTAHYQDALKQAQQLKHYVDDLNNLEYVDNGLALAKQYSYGEIKGCDEAVAAKLQAWAEKSFYKDWNDCPLDFKQKKLHFEVFEYYGKNLNGAQGKYKTWQVAEKAYTKQLKIVEDELWWNYQKSQQVLYAEFAKSTTSVVYKSALADLNKAIVAQDKEAAEQAIAALEKKKASLEKGAATRARNKAGSNPGAVTFEDDAYTKARKDNALWQNEKDSSGYYRRDKGDDYFRPKAEREWSAWDENQREVAFLYTDGSSYINEPLYTRYYSTKYGVRGEIRDSWKDINTLTDMIDKCEPLSRDVWLNRGQDSGAFLGQFGVSLSDYIHSPSQLVGKEGVNKPFTSCAHSKSWGFVGNGKEATNSFGNVTLNIYCPKGTKCIYTEPYSRFGSKQSMGYKWDGKEKVDVRNEVEVILQRGAKFRITKAEYKSGHWFIDVDLIGQPELVAGVS